MLTRHDLRWTYKIFQIGSALNVFPVTFEPVTGQMKSQDSGLKKCIFKIWQTLGFCHIFYLTLRTIYTGHFSGSTYRDFLSLMIILCVTFLGIFRYTDFIFVTRIEANVKVYNELLRIRGEIIWHFEKTQFNYKFYF